MRAIVLFAAAAGAIVVAAGLCLGLVFRLPAEHTAIAISGVVAVVVQLLAFTIAKLTMGTNMIAGWGIGSLVRVLVLAVYGLVFVKVLGLASAAALISLATFFFLSMLVEPLLLNS